MVGLQLNDVGPLITVCLDDVRLKMASPTPSLESLTGANSIGSNLDFRSFSPFTSESPTSVSSGSYSGSGVNSSSASKCCQCNENIVSSSTKVQLPCFHSYCEPCFEKTQDRPDKLNCFLCRQECVSDLISSEPIERGRSPLVYCTSCKSKTSDAVARCIDCEHYLCPNCVMAHQFMHCFEGHRVVNINPENGTMTNNKEESKTVIAAVENNKMSTPTLCHRHKTEPLKYFCRNCNMPVCKECMLTEHPTGLHDCEHISEAGPKQMELMNQAVQEGKIKATDIRNMLKNIDHNSGRLQVQYHKAQNEINDTFQFYRSMLEERKQELLKELESVFSSKQMTLTVMNQKAQETIDKIYQTCEFYERLTKHANMVECLLFKRKLETILQSYVSFNPDTSIQTTDIEFVSNYQAIQVGVRNTFGYVRSSSEASVGGPSKQPPIARPTSNGLIQPPNGIAVTSTTSSVIGSGLTSNGSLDRLYVNGLSTTTSTTGPFESSLISKRFCSANSLGPFTTTINDINLNGINPYEKWSSGGDVFQNGNAAQPTDAFSLTVGSGSDTLSNLELSSKLFNAASVVFPPKSQTKRQKMIYHCKFGEFGVLEGQFTEPSGVAVNAQNDIIVADTNNHRIQIFDKEGRFKFQFGECGKRDGQLLYPNRVAVVKTSGDIIVTERSPTHQIQIYNQYGQFVRKFGANILQHPRGVTVDNKGRIIVVECKVMRVIIFDQTGNVLQKFGCSKHLEFPNGVVVNDKQEIFISDNRAHCVKVFNYEGVFLRQIGSEGVTNYPIGVGINSAGEILIADNHNNFNLTIFTQEGQLVSALESKVKHAQCFDVALMDDGSVVLASKDYRLYIYRYVQVPPIGL